MCLYSLLRMSHTYNRYSGFSPGREIQASVWAWFGRSYWCINWFPFSYQSKRTCNSKGIAGDTMLKGPGENAGHWAFSDHLNSTVTCTCTLQIVSAWGIHVVLWLAHAPSSFSRKLCSFLNRWTPGCDWMLSWCDVHAGCHLPVWGTSMLGIQSLVVQRVHTQTEFCFCALSSWVIAGFSFFVSQPS